MKIIMYHYVREADNSMPHFIYLSVDSFRKQLDYFEDKFGILTYAEFLELIKNPDSYKTVKNKVLLSFDDGFLDHYKNVFPELLSRGLFGLFYIATAVYTKGKALDVHRIHYLLGRFGGDQLLKSVESRLTDEMLVDQNNKRYKKLAYDDQESDDSTQEFKKLFNYYISYAYRENLLDELVSEYCSDTEILSGLYMNIGQMQEMASQQMIIGSHSANHLVFSKLTEFEQVKEVTQSFSFLEKHLGKQEIKTFCYPYGGFHTFTKFTENLLEKQGCHISLNVDQRDMTLADLVSRPQALPRYDCNAFPYGKASQG